MYFILNNIKILFLMIGCYDNNYVQGASTNLTLTKELSCFSRDLNVV